MHYINFISLTQILTPLIAKWCVGNNNINPGKTLTNYRIIN